MKNKLTGAGLMTAVALSFGCHKSNVDNKDLRDFQQVNLVANTAEYQAKRIDKTLQNGFGVAWSPNGIAWVNSVPGHVSELYTADGDSIRPGIKIPASPTDLENGLPCGIVFSGGKGFRLPNGGTATFLFTGFDGVLSGWNGGNNAQFLRHPDSASYTGLAIAASAGQNYVYGANFGRKKIDVWDTAFHKINMSFTDNSIPGKYSPYNIQAVGDYLFVMYAELGPTGHGVAGVGKGYVRVFNTDGTLARKFASNGTLNIPWGVTLAPGSFLEDQDMGNNDGGHGGYDSKSYSGGGNDNNSKHEPKDPVILVGNFGDGRINVYTQDGNYLGQLQSHKHTIEIEGLWALSFAPTGIGIDGHRLYFSAGPDSEADGVFGYLIKQ